MRLSLIGQSLSYALRIVAVVLFVYGRAAAQSADLSSGLVGYWKFDSVVGSSTADFSTNSNPGTLFGSPSLVTGKFGNALHFENTVTGSGVEPAKFFGSATWSISAWVNPNLPIPTTDPYNGLFTIFSVDPNGKLFAIQKDGIYLYTTLITEYNFASNPGWHHIVITFNGSEISAIVDNRVVGQISSANVLARTDLKRRIGMTTTSKHSFKGEIDEVRLYNRQINSREIAGLFDSSALGIPAAPITVNKLTPTSPLPSWSTFTVVTVENARQLWCRASTTPGTPFVQMPLKFNSIAVRKPYLNIDGLEQGKSYIYYVRCIDNLGNETASELPVSFQTEADRTGPEIRELSASAIRKNTTEIVWSTNEPANSRVEITGPGQSAAKVLIEEAYGYPHAQLVTGLEDGLSYSYRVASTDRAGNTTYSPVRTFNTRMQAGRSYYVAPNGSDSNDGLSPSKPFASIDRARDVIRTLPRPLPRGGVEVILREGIYPRTSALVLTATDSGAENAPIVYRAFEGEDVRISGAVEISGFSPVTSSSSRIRSDVRAKVVQVDLRALGIANFGTRVNSGALLKTQAAPLELFFADNRMTVARYPNQNTSDKYAELLPISSTPDPTKTFVTTDGRPASWQSFDDIWVHGNWFFNHRHSVLKTTSIVPESGGGYRVTAPGDLTGMKAGRPFFYFNIPEELDSPGEYYVNAATGVLYFYPPAPITSGRSFVSVGGDLVAVNGASNVVFSGLTLENSRGTAISTNRDSFNVMFEGGIIRNTSVGAYLAGKHNGVWGSKIYNLEDNGVVLYGGKNATLEGGYNYVTNCEIYNFATLNKSYRGAVNISGIDTFTTSDPLGPTNGVANRVLRSYIHDGPHFAIAADGNNFLIDSNEITRVCLETIDCGAIYLYSNGPRQGTLVKYNFIHNLFGFDFEKLYQLSAVGLYLDNMQNGVQLTGNIVNDADVGALQNGGWNNVFENNLFARTHQPLSLNASELNIHNKFFPIPIFSLSSPSPTEIVTTRPHGNTFVYEYRPGNTVTVAGVDTVTGINGVWENQNIDASRMRLIGATALGTYLDGGFLIQSTSIKDRLEKYNYLSPPYSTFYPYMTKYYSEGDPAEPKGNRYIRNGFYNNEVQDLSNMYSYADLNPNNKVAVLTRRYMKIDSNNVNSVPFSVDDPATANLEAIYSAGLKRISTDQIGLLPVQPRAETPPAIPQRLKVGPQ